jgi:hypothetical protein
MALIPVKTYRNDDEGAPVVSNGVGDLTAMLDAVLVNGYNPKTIGTITRVGSLVTVTVPAGIVARLHQVIQISSNVDQPEYRGDQRVVAFTSNSFSFNVTGTPATPATATGAITCKTAPLGWEILFSATNKRVYRSLNSSSVKPCLRVDCTQLSGYTSTWTKFARVEMSTGYSDIDTATGPLAPYDFNNPTAGRAVTQTNFHGWAKWRQTWGTGPASQNSSEAVNDQAGTRMWDIVGDDRIFYMVLRPGAGVANYGVNGNYSMTGPFYAFGEIKSRRPGDSVPAILHATESYFAVTASLPTPASNCDIVVNASASTFGKFMMRDATLLGGHINHYLASLGTKANVYSGYDTGIAYPNPAGYSVILHPMTIVHGTTVRGTIPGALCVHNNVNSSGVRTFINRQIIDGAEGYPDKKFMILTYGPGSTYVSQELEMFAIDLLGPWEH